MICIAQMGDIAFGNMSGESVLTVFRRAKNNSAGGHRYFESYGNSKQALEHHTLCSVKLKMQYDIKF